MFTTTIAFTVIVYKVENHSNIMILGHDMSKSLGHYDCGLSMILL